MGIFDKVKNLFTEEIEEEQPIKREVRHVEVPAPKPSIEKKEPQIEREVKIEPQPVKEEKPTTREEKFVFFSDDDFKDLEKPKAPTIKKEIKKEEKPLAYKGAVPKTNPEPKKEFKPSPIISPVYGVLNKNYQKEEIKRKTSPRVYRSSNITIDDVRNKAYGTLEDEIKDDLLGKTIEEVEDENINIFDEIDQFENPIQPEVITRNPDDVDLIFGKLDTKKEEILDELDSKKEEILDELDNKKDSFNLLTDDIEIPDVTKNIETDEEIYNSDIDLSKNLLEDSFDDDTASLAKELEEQKQKLSEINEMMNKSQKTTKTKSKKKKVEEIEEDLNDSELFELIDSMYEKKDDE